MLELYLLLCLSFLFTVFVLVSCRHSISKRLPLPPGPKGRFLIGVKHLLSPSEPWKRYAEWAQDFASPIISFKVYNRRMLILNDHISIRDLLDKRANIYSDRPKSWMYHHICERGKAVFNISATDLRHKQYRRILQAELGSRATRNYWHILEDEARVLLRGLRDTPQDFQKHLRRNAAAMIMKVAYGYTVHENDYFIGVAEESAKISSQALAPGRWLVDYYPILRFIPTWFPFAKFKRQGEEWKKRLVFLSDVPHEWVKTQMASGTYTESFTSRLLRPDGVAYVDSADEDIIKWCAGGLYAGASDTILSALTSFILLMAAHPHIQRQAQDEITAVLGPDQLPQASDLGRFGFLHAVLSETLRFAPVANLALPHKVIEDDEYRGFHIPRDTTVVANVWAIMHDASLFPNPHNFNPTRFLSSPKDRRYNPDPRAFAFGFGRRTCPGLQFAETTLLLNMAAVLSRFTISLPSEKEVPVIEFTSGITSHVKPFDIKIVPRQNVVDM